MKKPILILAIFLFLIHTHPAACMLVKQEPVITRPSKEKITLLKRILRDNPTTVIEMANVPDHLKDRFTVAAMKQSIFSLLNALEEKNAPQTVVSSDASLEDQDALHQKKKKAPSIIAIDVSKIFALLIPAALPPAMPLTKKKKKKKKPATIFLDNVAPQHIVLKQGSEKATCGQAEQEQLIAVLKKAITVSAITGEESLTMCVDIDILRTLFVLSSERAKK